MSCNIAPTDTMAPAERPNETPSSLRIGPWTVWPSLNRAQRGGDVIHLEPKPMEILTYLAARPGEVISRRELQDSIWGEVYVADGSLTLAVSKLRKAFGESARSPRLIETIAKRGYRLVSTVRSDDLETAPLETVPLGAMERVTEVQVAAAVLERTSAEKTSAEKTSAEDLGAESTRTAPPTKNRGKVLKVASRAFVPLVAAAALVTQGSLPSDAPEPPTPAHVLESRPLTIDPGIEAHPALSSEGDLFAFVRASGSPEASSSIVISSMTDLGSSERIVEENGGLWPTFSPRVAERQTLAFAREGKEGCRLFLFDLESETEESLGSCGDGMSWGLDWSKDGRRLVYSRHDGSEGASSLYALDLTSLRSERLTEPPIGSLGDGHARHSPDGLSLAFSRSRSRFVDELRVLDLEKGTDRMLWLEKGPIYGLTWSPEGDGIIYSTLDRSGFGLWFFRLEGRGPERLLLPYGQAIEPHFAAGRLAVRSPTWSSQIHRLDLGTGESTPWRPSTELDRSPEHSIDGQSVVFSSRRGGAFDLWLAAADGRSPRRLTKLRALAIGRASFSPGGDQIAFPATTDTFSALHLLDFETGFVRQLTRGDWDDLTPSFSRDGRHLYFSSDRDGSWQVWRIETRGGRAERITDRGGLAPVEVEGGDLVYSKLEGGVYRRTPAGAEQLLAEAPPGSRWIAPHASKQGVEFIRKANGQQELVRFEWQSGEVRVLAILPSLLHEGALSLSADGSEALFSSYQTPESDILVVENLVL